MTATFPESRRALIPCSDTIAAEIQRQRQSPLSRFLSFFSGKSKGRSCTSCDQKVPAGTDAALQGRNIYPANYP